MSIESLKKSAKKLHRALQEGPNLTLMQVQHHLAVSHGYKSWDEAVAQEMDGPFTKKVILDEAGQIFVQQGLSDKDLIELKTRLDSAPFTRFPLTRFPLKGFQILKKEDRPEADLDQAVEENLKKHNLKASPPAGPTTTARRAPEKRVVLDNTGTPVFAQGLEDNEMSELKGLLDQAKSDPDFVIFTSYDVSAEDPDLQKRLFCYPDATSEELELRRKACGFVAKVVPNPKGLIDTPKVEKPS